MKITHLLIFKSYCVIIVFYQVIVSAITFLGDNSIDSSGAYAEIAVLCILFVVLGFCCDVLYILMIKNGRNKNDKFTE